MRKNNKITVNGKTYLYKVSISPYYKVWEGNGDTSTIPCRPCHEHNCNIEIQEDGDNTSNGVRRINCRVFYYLKDGVPSRHSCRYSYAGIVEARLQKFISKLV